MRLFRKNKNGEKEVHWACLGEECPDNCCGFFNDKSPNYIPADKLVHYDIMLLDDEKDFFKKNKSLGKIIIEKEDKYCLKLGDNRECPLFKGGKCSQYKHRPAVCKAYPFYLDLFSGLNIDKSCPGVGRGWMPVHKIKPFLRSLARVYKEHIKNL